MKKRLFLMAGVLCMALLMAGCGGQKTEDPAPEQTPEPVEIEYSNLVKPEVWQELAGHMADAGITQERQDVFYDHVEQVNALLAPEELAQGYEVGDAMAPKYDPYELQDRWNETHRDFMGYNCRITAFSLFGDFLSIPPEAPVRGDLLTFDLEALKMDSSACPGQAQQFTAFYSKIPTENTKDVEVHLANVQEDWKERGITFVDDPRVRLISMVFHDIVDEDESSLFIGHTGILLPVSTDELYFVEKLSFQEPYQCVKLASRQELNDYLMGRYDVEYGQPSAAPFIMENDQLMEGYGRLSEH